MTKSVLSRNIRYLRKQKNWSQQDLADRLNRVHATISKWENEKEAPDIETLIQLSNMFEVSLDYLLGNHYKQDEYVKEFNRLYQIQDNDAELMEIVDYLKQNPEFKHMLHTYTNLHLKDQQFIGEFLKLYLNRLS